MENKHRAVKNLSKTGKRFNRKARKGCFDEVLFARLKGNLKLLDEGDYQKFSSFLSTNGKVDLNDARLFLEEKIESYRNYDFWPEDQRIKEQEYKRERNLFLIKILNSVIDFLMFIRNKLGGI